jgi:hypothetical protein
LRTGDGDDRYLASANVTVSATLTLIASVGDEPVELHADHRRHIVRLAVLGGGLRDRIDLRPREAGEVPVNQDHRRTHRRGALV